MTSHHFIIQEETRVQHQEEKEQRKLNAMGDENFIPTKNVAGPPVFYPQGNEQIFETTEILILPFHRRFVHKEQGGCEGAGGGAQRPGPVFQRELRGGAGREEQGGERAAQRRASTRIHGYRLHLR